MEVTMTKHLEEAAVNWICNHKNGEVLYVKDAFIAGAKWQKEQMMKDGNVILSEEDFDAEKEKSVEWGYSLCKEQMMKEAMEGEVKDFCFVREVNYSSAKIEFSTIPELKVGDKVRVIIVKED
jgi:uncharacterized Fe-S cluster-containing radical SAM superfamily enzyme